MNIHKLVAVSASIAGGVVLAFAFGLRLYGPYASGSTDSGTCGNLWADDTFDRVFQVDPTRNPDGTYSVTEFFRNGHFTTNAGSSPGACEGGPNNGNTLPDGVTGVMQGSFTIVVSGGEYDPAAVPTAPAYTADFVHSVFGEDATYDVPTYRFNYDAGDYGSWKNASPDRGGDFGDIYSH